MSKAASSESLILELSRKIFFFLTFEQLIHVLGTDVEC